MGKEVLYKELYTLAEEYKPVYRKYIKLVETEQPYQEVESELNAMIKKGNEIKRQIEELS